MFHDIIVIGGGASGIMSSLMAKDMGKDVAIIEHKDRIAKKILITGNGRCNISNKKVQKNNFHSSSSSEVIQNTLSSFDLDSTINFFKSIGLNLIELENGKLYPMSLQASSVVDIFLKALEDKSIETYTNHSIKSIDKSNGIFTIETNQGEFTCNKLIMATGGKSYTKSGSDGSGYRLAKSLGHSLIQQRPAIVQVVLDFHKLKAISGVKFIGKVNLMIDNKLEASDSGEILFTDYGISGPPILQLSRYVSHNSNVCLKLDLFPHMSPEELQAFLESHWGIVGYRSVLDSFIGIINKKLVPTFLKCCGISNIHKSCWELSEKEIASIVSTLKSWSFNAVDTKGFDSAQVTCGGVNCSEVDSSTLESKKTKNLYFCGEVLDVDGDCGGFNLQWAWSSGAVAAINASK